MENNSTKKTKDQNFIFRFFGNLFRFIKGYFIVVGALVTITIIAGLYFLFATLNHVSEKSAVDEAVPYVMELTLSGSILDRGMSAEEIFIADLTGDSVGLDLTKLEARLKEVAKNQNLKGLMVYIDNLGGSRANYDELRMILEDFKASGKDLQFWFSSGGYHAYYLASLGSKISVPPVSSLMMTGPTFSMTYFGEALKKLGVGIEVVRSGKYKSAFESFIQNQPSEATLEMYRSMEESMRQHYAGTIATSRNLNNSPVETVSGWFKKTLFTVQELGKMGIVDHIEYKEAALKRMKTELGVANHFKLKFGGLTPSDPFTSSQDGIAFIEAVGSITMGGTSSNDQITYQNLSKQIEWAKDEPTVRAVVLRVSSPGGAAIASDLIWQDMKKLVEVKPVVVSMGSVAASGGYYIAAPASKIFALPNTITGSIGVIGMVPNFQEFEEKYGVSFHMVTASDRRGLLNTGEKLSEADKSMFRESIDEMYQDFLNRVAEGRKMPVSDVHAIAQGRVWTGLQAKEMGLVDKIGGLDEAIEEAKRLAELDPTVSHPIKRYLPQGASLMECMRYTSNFSDCLSNQSRSILATFKSQMMSKSEKKVYGLKQVVETFDKEPLQARWDGAIDL